MDKNAIKKYAVWARTELIDRVRQRAVRYEVTADANPNVDSASGKVLTPIEKTQRQAAIARMRDKGYEYVIEEVAYSWFNRFAALRYMEVNNYLPSRVRVFTDENGSFKPQILAEALHLNLDGLDMEKVYALKEAEDNDELYKYLLITQCNALSAVLPQMFKPVDEKCKQEKDDYTILLFPDNLLREGSVVEQMVTLISEDNWLDAVQIIGWLYQYYNIEPKDKVFGREAGTKIQKEDIPAATQLFTPDWIVRYMVENSLGRLWLEGHPQNAAELLPTEKEQAEYVAGDRKIEDSKWHYYLKEAEQGADVQGQLTEIRKEYSALKPEDILCIDPCMGSGHIIVYMFDALMKVYAAYGYSTRESVQSIIENNLYGLDIDDRAAQLAYFAVMMKAVQYDNRFLKRSEIPQPHVFAIKESNHLDSFAVEYFCNGDKKLTVAMHTLIEEMHDATEYGSILNITHVDFASLYARFEEIKNDISMYREIVLNEILPFLQVAEILAQQYDIVITNPPYMKADTIPAKLNDFILNYHEDAKYDLYSAFIYRCHEYVNKSGIMSMITMHNFMFSPSFQMMRDNIKSWHWLNMVHLGSRAFSDISGEVVQTTAFAISKKAIVEHMHVVDVTAIKQPEEKEHVFLRKQAEEYKFDLNDIEYIPGHAFGYALSDTVIELYKQHQILENFGVSKAGVVTGADDLFVRLWHEIDYTKITFEPSHGKLYEYVLFSKGGTFFKWFGNSQNVLKLNDMWDDNKTNKSVRRGDPDFYYKRGIGWSQMGGGVNKSFSEIDRSVCKTTTPMFYVTNPKHYNYILAYLNSNIPPIVLKSLNPTLSILTSDIMNLPFVFDETKIEEIDSLVSGCYSIAKNMYEQYEQNWQFNNMKLIGSYDTVEAALANWHDLFVENSNKIMKNQKRINEIFCTILELEDISENEILDSELDIKGEIKALISYAVGCMFGRYSLERDGITYAGGEWDVTKYTVFSVDKDNIIPICDDEYFDDDITGLFVKFVKTVYGKDTLNENLKFIADALGGKGTPKEVIRNYFLNDFFADHCKMYQKRPIYWLFDSGKKNGFKALVYMHRYQPDTIARMRTDYVHEQQSRYRTAIADLENRIAGASTSERVRLTKQLSKLQDQSAEIHTYEEKIHHLADRMIAIDLDDGVKHNYEIFKDVLAKIK